MTIEDFEEKLYKDGLEKWVYGYLFRYIGIQDEAREYSYGFLKRPDGRLKSFVSDADGRPIIGKSYGYLDEDEKMEFWLYDMQRTVFERDFENFEPELIAYMLKEYGYSEAKTKMAVEKLSQDTGVAFEFYWYTKHGKFPEERFSAYRGGYSAEKIKEAHPWMTVLGAFNYMVYLKNKPEEALKNLRKGLPRK